MSTFPSLLENLIFSAEMHHFLSRIKCNLPFIFIFNIHLEQMVLIVPFLQFNTESISGYITSLTIIEVIDRDCK